MTDDAKVQKRRFALLLLRLPGWHLFTPPTGFPDRLARISDEDAEVTMRFIIPTNSHKVGGSLMRCWMRCEAESRPLAFRRKWVEELGADIAANGNSSMSAVVAAWRPKGLPDTVSTWSALILPKSLATARKHAADEGAQHRVRGRLRVCDRSPTARSTA